MLDDDDGVGLRTDGPLISLKTHEDSQSGGDGPTGEGEPRAEPCPGSLCMSLHGGQAPCQPPYVLRICVPV